MYTYDEVFEKSKEYFGGDELAASVFAGKYALQDSDGNYLESNPDDMHKRLANQFAKIEAQYTRSMSYEEIYSLFKDFKVSWL